MVTNPDQLPTLVTARYVHWNIEETNGERVEIVLDKRDGQYSATYLAYDDDAHDWIEGDRLPPGASLILAAEHQLIVPA